MFPVEIVQASDEVQTPEGEQVLQLRPRHDGEREALSKALDIDTPAIRLKDALLNDATREEGWTLTGNRTLGERATSDTDWRF